MKQYNRAVLFANGQPGTLERVILSPEDYLVAVDGGLNHLKHLKLTPHLLIGDLDSVGPELPAVLEAQGIEVLRFPPAKDQTDLELALFHVLAKGFDEVLIVAALGGRLDQTLGNLALFTNPDFENVNIYLDDGNLKAFIIHESIAFSSKPGDVVSLIPLCKPVSGISTWGLAYPLRNETLNPHQTRGVSNLATGNEVNIQIAEGVLLCLHDRQQIEEE